MNDAGAYIEHPRRSPSGSGYCPFSSRNTHLSQTHKDDISREQLKELIYEEIKSFRPRPATHLISCPCIPCHASRCGCSLRPLTLTSTVLSRPGAPPSCCLAALQPRIFAQSAYLGPPHQPCLDRYLGPRRPLVAHRTPTVLVCHACLYPNSGLPTRQYSTPICQPLVSAFVFTTCELRHVQGEPCAHPFDNFKHPPWRHPSRAHVKVSARPSRPLVRLPRVLIEEHHTYSHPLHHPQCRPQTLSSSSTSPLPPSPTATARKP